MTPIKQPPVDALNAPLPPSYQERARRRRTPLLLIVFGSALLHILFLGFVMAHQPTVPPRENLIEIDLREPKPVKKVVEPKPLKIIKHIAPKPAPLKPLPKPKTKIAPVVKPPKPAVAKPKPKVAKIEKPLKKQPPVKPSLANPLAKPRPAINPTKPNPAPRTVSEPSKATPPQLPKSLHVGALPKPPSAVGESKGSGRPHRGDEAAPAPGLPGAERIAMAPSARPTRGTNPFDDLDAKQPTSGGKKNNGQQTPLPLGEKAQRLTAAGTALSNPAFSHSLASSHPGGGDASLTTGNPGQGAPRNRNNDLAGTNGAGGMQSPRPIANAGGRPRPSSNIMAYIDATGRDHDSVSVAPGAFGPGNGGGAGAGNRRGSGTGLDKGSFSRSPLNVRTGSGSGSGIGGNPWRGRGSGEAASGGGAGGGRGSGLGGGMGQGGGSRGPRAAGNLFGDLTGSKGGGDTHGGGGSGGGPGGSGKGTQLARQDGGGSGGSGQSGSGNGPSFGRGGIGAGTGAGTGVGTSNKGKGAGGKGDRDGRGDTVGDDAGGKGAGGGHHPGMVTAKRKHEGGDIIGRGVWGSWTVKFYQDKSDHPDKANAKFGPGHAIDWPVFTDLKATKSDKTLNFDWGTKPPAAGMKDTYWSARITGKIFVPKDDDYWFYFDQLDDAGRLVLDGKQVIKVWKVQKSTPDSGKIHLTRGEHSILIEYVQGPGTEASLTLSWKSSSFPKEIVGIYKPGE